MYSEVVELFQDLVLVDSISKNERKMADFLKNKLDDMGLEYYEDDAGEKIGGNTGNLIALKKGIREKPKLLFMAHMDTVTPGIGKKSVIRDNTIYSEGDTILGADDFAGIAIILAAIKNVIDKRTETGDIYIVFTVAEELGLLGARYLDTSSINSDYAFILDSNGEIGTLCLKAPAHDNIEVKIIGKASHAGIAPEKGINAIVVAAEAITNMKLGRIDEETTANIGIIEGGRATNIVCEEVIAKGEARSHDDNKLSAQIAHMKECFENSAKKYDAVAEIKVNREYLSYNIDINDTIVTLAKKAAKSKGIEVKTISSGGGSDTNILNSKGIKTINIGIGMENVHSKDEKIKIENLEKGVEFLTGIIENV